MKMGMLCIGDELLDGRTINTNSAWLGDRLIDAGHDLHQVLIVKDRIEEIHFGLSVLEKTCEFIFTSGGIGPTEDDITVESIAKYYKKDFALDEAELKRIEILYATRGLKLLENSKKQAFKPKDGIFITNPKGVASGVYWAKEKILTLAGVPSEFYGIYEEFLKQVPKFSDLKNSHPLVWNIYGIPEGVIDETAKKLQKSSDAYATYRIIYPCVELRLMNETNETNIKNWKKTFDPLAFSLKQGEKLEEVLINKGRLSEVEIIAVESCTGGMISKLLTDIPGSSDVFLGGLITYSNDFKIRVGVEESLLETYGAMSEEVLKEMLSSGFTFLPQKPNKKRLVLAVTGYAGPISTSNNETIGTVHIGVSLENNKTKMKKFEFGKRQRDQIRSLSCAAAIQMALELLS